MILRVVAVLIVLLLGSVLGQHEDQHLCNIDAECPVKNCMDVACVKDICVYKEVVCDASGDDSCIVSLGCQVDTNHCVYERLDCDDYNPCTEDTCSRDEHGAAYCSYTHLNDCEDNVDHSVVFHNANDWKLQVKTYGDQLEFCHTTSYIYDEDRSVAVLGFSPYVRGQLTERGTCDNFLNGGKENDFNDNLWHIASSRDSSTDVECRADKNLQDFELENIFSMLRWNEATSRFVDLGGGRVHISGQIYGVGADDGLVFTVDVYMDYDPLYERIVVFPEHCYNSLSIDPSTWLGYRLVRGQLIAASRSLYDGLVIDLESGSMQTGYGASPASFHHGFNSKFQWRVAHQPHNSMFEFTKVSRSGSMHGDFTADYKDENTLGYCDLFEDKGVSLESGRWSSTWIDEHSVVYCSNFSVDDLLRCRGPYDEYASVFTRNSDDDYSYIRGQLYHTVVHQPWNCEKAQETEGEPTSTIFDIDIRMSSKDSSSPMEARVTTTQPNFEVLWLGNTWACCDEDSIGELKIGVRTRSPEGRRLIDARVVSEMGAFMRFLDDHVDCTIDEEGYCVQDWTLQSYSAEASDVFSDMKLLAWTSLDSGVHALVYMTVHAMHIGIQDHFEGDSYVSVTSGLYTNRAFTDVYDAKEHMILDGAQLFGLVCLNEHRHLDLSIREVSICSSDACEERLPVFSLDADVVSPYNFELLRDPPSTTHCEGFSITAKTRGDDKQRILIQWATEEVGGHGGLIELFDDDHDGPHHSHNDSSQYFLSRCPSGWYYDYDIRECRFYDHHDNTSALWALFGVAIFIALIFFAFRYYHHYYIEPSPASYVPWPRPPEKTRAYRPDGIPEMEPL